MKDTLRIGSSVFKNQPYIAFQEKEKILKKKKVLFPEENESDFDWKQNCTHELSESPLTSLKKRPDGQMFYLFLITFRIKFKLKILIYRKEIENSFNFKPSICKLILLYNY
jgi:hypothetical protein